MGEFVVCHNRPENDADWADASKAETASMAGPDPVTSAVADDGGDGGGGGSSGGLPGHVFITCKDLRWDCFNVLVMGMEGTRKDVGGGGAAEDVALEARGRALHVYAEIEYLCEI